MKRQRILKTAIMSLAFVTPCLGFADNKPLTELDRYKQKMRRSACVFILEGKLEIYSYDQTDPALLQEILADDMHLADLPGLSERWDAELTKPQSLRPMLGQVTSGIIERQPELADFICEALGQDLVKMEEGSKSVINRVIHHTYLLEKLTQEMAHDWHFMVSVQNHLLKKREAFGIPSDFMGSVRRLHEITGDIFEPVKTKTMDWVFSEYERIRQRGHILDEEISARQNGTKFNILEAAITENNHGHTDNAMAGIALAVNPPKTIRIVGDHRFLEYDLSQDWVSLYESWNMAFITANINHLDVLYPKLLIPSVINAEAPEYLFNRALSLWVSINFHLFAQLEQKPDRILPHKQELAKIWGEVNHASAKRFSLAEKNTELTAFSGLLKMTMKDLWAQLKNLLLSSGVIDEDEAEELTQLL